MLRQSLLHRRARSLSALVAMTVSAAVATALLTLYADLDAKLHHEFSGVWGECCRHGGRSGKGFC